MKTYKPSILILSLVALAGCQGYAGVDSPFQESSLQSIEVGNLVIDSNNSKYKLAIERSFSRPESIEESTSRIGITSHHLPVAADFVGEFYEQFLSDEDDLFIVIGPDHPEKCEDVFSTGDHDYKTNFGLLESEPSIVEELVESGFVNMEPGCFEKEHSIGVQADYIKMTNPEARIVPISVSSSAGNKESRELAKFLTKYYDEAKFVISVDFNHYRTVNQAGVYDQETREAIMSMDVEDLKIDNVDSPPSLLIGVELARLMKKDPEIIGYTNSYEYTGHYANTTSYFNVLFQ